MSYPRLIRLNSMHGVKKITQIMYYSDRLGLLYSLRLRLPDLGQPFGNPKSIGNIKYAKNSGHYRRCRASHYQTNFFE